MISSVLNGGLGNQLFQIAAAYGVALEVGDKCAFNFYNHVVMQGKSGHIYRDTVYSKLMSLPKDYKPLYVYEESGLDYKPIPYEASLQLKGYFQSSKYFDKYRDFIVDLFTHQPTIKKLKHEYGNILRDSVSLHVRRGDYLITGDFIGVNYYDNALLSLFESNQVNKVLVFSDDIDWCEKNLFHKGLLDVIYVKGNKDYEDLYLQSLCTYNICANSSFSWWGAYLNQNPDKKVYMPEPWTASHGKDIYPSGTIIIPR
jgi:hypothetical protein